jgi:hypothetical protein
MVLEARKFNSADSVSGAGLCLSKMAPVAASSHSKKGRGGLEDFLWYRGTNFIHEVSTMVMHSPDQLIS